MTPWRVAWVLWNYSGQSQYAICRIWNLRTDLIHDKEVPPVDATMEFLDNHMKSVGLSCKFSMEEFLKKKNACFWWWGCADGERPCWWLFLELDDSTAADMIPRRYAGTICFGAYRFVLSITVMLWKRSTCTNARDDSSWSRYNPFGHCAIGLFRDSLHLIRRWIGSVGLWAYCREDQIVDGWQRVYLAEDQKGTKWSDRSSDVYYQKSLCIEKLLPRDRSSLISE